jgi:hypothetical protein
MKTFLKILLTGTFLLAGIFKIQDPVGFQAGIASFQLFPEWLLPTLAYNLPFLEIFCALGLWHKAWEKTSAICLLLFSLGFAGCYGFALANHITPDCGCFGKFLKVTPFIGFLRAILLFNLALVLLIKTKIDNSLCKKTPNQ